MDKKYKYMCGIIFLLANAAAIAAGIFFFWSGQERVQGFIDTVSENENMKIVKKIECEGQLEIAMPQLQKAIEEGIEFDSVFASTIWQAWVLRLHWMRKICWMKWICMGWMLRRIPRHWSILVTG